MCSLCEQEAPLFGGGFGDADAGGCFDVDGGCLLLAWEDVERCC